MLNHEIDQWDLSGQVALVTGGTRGLGQAFARGLSAAGARVVITGRSADRVEAVVAELSTPEDTPIADSVRMLSLMRATVYLHDEAIGIARVRPARAAPGVGADRGDVGGDPRVGS